MTKFVNRFTIATGTICMILAGLLPPIGNFFSSLPESVSKAGFNQRNVTIVALSLTVGIGFTSGTEANIGHIFPQIIQDVFAGNCVAVVFIVSIILSLVLPKDMDIKKIK